MQVSTRQVGCTQASATDHELRWSVHDKNCVTRCENGKI